MADLLAPLGPLFGPNFQLITVKPQQQNGGNATSDELSYALQIYADALNPELKEAGLQTHYYYQPSRAYLARRQDNPEDYDFGVFIFKGLMSQASTIGANDEDGIMETGGGWCVFTTTFAVPDWVLADALKQLQEREGSAHGDDPGVMEKYFNYDPTKNMPVPNLGMVPVIRSSTALSVPKLEGNAQVPMTFTAQGMGKGSIEAHGFNSFHVSCDQWAAGAMAASIDEGVAPFTIHNELEELFYTTETRIEIVVDAKKVHTAFSAAVGAGGFFGIDAFKASAAYEKCLTTNAIETKIMIGDADASPETRKWILDQAQDLRTKTFELVKNEIFDWEPTTDSKAAVSEDRSWFSSIFGGALVSLKASYAERGYKGSEKLTLIGPVKRTHSVSGTLNELQGPIRRDKKKYLRVSEIDQWFKKIQVAARTDIDFAKEDAIASVGLQVKYPTYDTPVVNGQPNWNTQDQGPHYSIKPGEDARKFGPAVWQAGNQNAIVNIAFSRLEESAAGWPPNRLRMTKTIVFASTDQRVALAGGKNEYVYEWDTEERAPSIGLGGVGYLEYFFRMVPEIRSTALTGTLVVRIGDYTRSFSLDSSNKGQVTWELYSDKYAEVAEITYDLTVTIANPSDPFAQIIELKAPTATVQAATGRLKAGSVALTMPSVPADQLALAREYVAAAAGVSNSSATG